MAHGLGQIVEPQMEIFTVPAGRRVRFTARSNAALHAPHRWSVTVHPHGAAATTPALLTYGSEIEPGEDQRIEAPEQAFACDWRVDALHWRSHWWAPDIAVRAPDQAGLRSISFNRGEAAPLGECVLEFTILDEAGADAPLT